MLPRQKRLTKSKEIGAVKRRRKYLTRTPLLKIFAQENQLDESRLAVVATKQLGKAVFRNRIRRRTKAAFAIFSHNKAKKYDIVVYPAKKVEDVKLAEIVTAMNKLMD